MFKYTLPSFVKFLLPNCIWKVNTNDKVLYLTFDDGPHAQITNWVLNILQEYNAAATFFCVGDNVVKNPLIIKKMLNNGHAIGNHTQNHLNYFKTNKIAYLNNINLAKQHINSNLFRPPYGRISYPMAKIIGKQYKIIMWSKLSCDYNPKLNRKDSLNALLKSKPGDIIVFHDSEKAFENLKFLLPALLAAYTNKGFAFKALTNL